MPKASNWAFTLREPPTPPDDELTGPDTRGLLFAQLLIQPMTLQACLVICSTSRQDTVSDDNR